MSNTEWPSSEALQELERAIIRACHESGMHGDEMITEWGVIVFARHMEDPSKRTYYIVIPDRHAPAHTLEGLFRRGSELVGDDDEDEDG